MATLSARLRSGLSRTLDSAKTHLRSATRGLPTPDSLFAVQSQRFDHVSGKLVRGLVSALQVKRIEYQKCAGKLGISLLGAPVERKKQKLEYAINRLQTARQSQIEYKYNALAKARLTPNLLIPTIRDARQRLDYIMRRLETGEMNRSQKLNQRLEQASRLLASFSHEKTLERGFTLMRDMEGNVVTRAGQTTPNQAYEVEFADSRIGVIRNDGVKAATTGSKPTSKAIKSEPSTKQGSLF